ncbi:MAG: UvrD-helicase domain-containing protein [Lachnospiraceae bacterium]|nr:UvrD-helicase domain-containing protein [Lachnospiraceae bacterium]
MSIYDHLNEQQKEAAFTVNGPLLILAGAGSGKTSVLTHRIAYLIDEAGVNPYNILAITFTNKAAGEMRERVDNLVGFGSEQIHVSTFHSMCVRILRRYADCIGYDGNFTIYDTDDQKHIMKEVTKKLQIDTKQIKEREIMNAISHCKDELITPQEYLISSMGDFRQKKLADCYVEYQAALKKNNAFDFDDLLMKTVELFKSCPDVLANYQKRWQYIMVDEYQDTNTAQFELIRLLAGSTKNLCVVGDDDQSIYRFRGANIRNILDFEHYYPEAKVVKLEQNYRSCQNILDAANSVIRNNSARKEKALWSQKDKGSLIHFRQFDNGFEESEYVSSEIRRAVRNGDCMYGENAILYRTNAQSRPLEERLVRDNVPYKIVGGVNFYSRREIKDLLAYLKTIDNGRDDLAVKRIINIPKRGIGATTINKVQDAADAYGISFFEALDRSEITGIKGATQDKLHSFVNMIGYLRAVLENKGVEAILDEVLDITDYINQMDVETEEEAEDRVENIEELRSKVASYCEESENPSLSELLEEIALIADIDSLEEGDDRLILMTIHAAKGLEFKNVYLVGMEDGLFPSYMSISTGDVEVEEERRLAYVAITRAKEDLTITCARARMNHGETQYNPVSRFVREIPRELFDIAPMVQKRRDDYDDFDSPSFERKPYSVDGFSGFKRNSESSSNSGYGGFSRTPSQGGYSESYGGYKRTGSSSMVKEEKPFIATMSGIKKGSDIMGSGSSADYGVGDRVKHIKFGEGTILKMEDAGKDKKVTVQFDTAGVRVMMASFARLAKI